MPPRYAATILLAALTACSDTPLDVVDVSGGGVPARIAADGPLQSDIAIDQSDTLVVIVTNAQGKRVSGAAVDWQIVEDAGRIAALDPVTDTRGAARAVFFADSIAGPVTVRVKLRENDSTVHFQIRIAPGPFVLEDTVDIALGADTVLTLRDRYGNIAVSNMSWTVADPSIARASALRLSGLRVGTTSLSATVAGQSVQTVLRVVGWADVSASYIDTCGVLTNGVVVCFGMSYTEPRAIAVPGGAQAVGVGTAQACALAVDGAAWCWSQDAPAPARVATSERFVELRVGSFTTCARTADGRVFCWGDNPTATSFDNKYPAPTHVMTQTRFTHMSRPAALAGTVTEA